MHQNLVFVVLAAVVGSLAYAQDAEIIPDNIPRRDSSSNRDDDGILIVNFRPGTSNDDPLVSFFEMFRPRLFPFSPVIPSALPRFPSFPDFTFGFPNISDLIPSEFPDIGTLPDDYHNSTHDVSVVNGKRIETNTTVSRRKNNNGVFVQEVHIVRYTPENEGKDTPDASGGDVSPSPKVNSFDNEIPKKENSTKDYEDFGITSASISRKRRWVIPEFLQRLFGNSKSKTLSTDQPLPTPSPTFRSLTGDTRVNYIKNDIHNIAPDAEIVDPTSLMKDRQISLAENLDYHHHHPLSEMSTPITSSRHRSSATSHRAPSTNRRRIRIWEEEDNANRLSTRFSFNPDAHSAHRTASAGYRSERYFRSQNTHRIHRHRTNL